MAAQALRRGSAALPLLCLASHHASRRPSRCDDRVSTVSYYPFYEGDRFGGGIGRRVGVDESCRQPLGNTGVVRVAVFSETHERLRAWATEEHWREATRIHKAAFFTRTSNPLQEAVLERVRQHYVGCAATGYVARDPIQAVLYRLEGADLFRKRCEETRVSMLPLVLHRVFDERSEGCIVDFANKRLGGGWLGYGMAQEEKLFIERPDYGALCAKSLLDMPDPVAEPLASPFSMGPDEAWVLRGAPAFAHVPWYGWTRPGALESLELLDPAADAATAPTVVAIDALKAGFESYERGHLDLVLAKAYVGFTAAQDNELGLRHRRIATGAWGCGAFLNNERVMFTIQTLAANLAGVELAYHVVGSGRTLAPAIALLEQAMLEGWTVERCLGRLAELCASDPEWRSKYRAAKDRVRARL